MARLICALLVLLPLAAQTSIEFATVSKDIIERNLRAVEDSNLKREQKLHSMFEEAGCTGDRLREQPLKHVKSPNIICTLPGETDSVILVGAHTDFVDRGKGVVDNWSGCSMLPALFTSLKAAPRRHTFVLVGFTHEEQGLVGSKFYVRELGKAGLEKLNAVVNLDSLGTGPTKFEMDRADRNMAEALLRVASTFKLSLSVVNAHKVGRSDSDSFQDHKAPTINIHSLTQETWPILHTRRDRMDAIHFDDYYDSYLLIRAYLAYLDKVR
ncbi:MAG TPA: M28 family peptidase [Bryobacteraceae bacterium]